MYDHLHTLYYHTHIMKSSKESKRIDIDTDYFVEITTLLRNDWMNSIENRYLNYVIVNNPDLDDKSIQIKEDRPYFVVLFGEYIVI